MCFLKMNGTLANAMCQPTRYKFDQFPTRQVPKPTDAPTLQRRFARRDRCFPRKKTNQASTKHIQCASQARHEGERHTPSSIRLSPPEQTDH